MSPEVQNPCGCRAPSPDAVLQPFPGVILVLHGRKDDQQKEELHRQLVNLWFPKKVSKHLTLQIRRLNVITDNVMFRLTEIKLAKAETILNKKVGMTFVDHVISVKLQQSYRDSRHSLRPI